MNVCWVVVATAAEDVNDDVNDEKRLNVPFVVLFGFVFVVVFDVEELFTIASVNIIQSKLTISRINSIIVVITRIKLVTSRLPLKLKITLVVMVSRFYDAMLVQKGLSQNTAKKFLLSFSQRRKTRKKSSAAQSGSLSYVTLTVDSTTKTMTTIVALGNYDIFR